jgi:hypothetical protein
VATILARLLKEKGITSTSIGTNIFKDLTANNWALNSIQLVQAAGLMKGDLDGNFRPDDVITRAELAVIALRWNGQDAVSSLTTFSDTSIHWAKDIIETVKSKTWMTGYKDNTSLLIVQ